MTTYRLLFSLSGLPPSMNARLHWRKRHKANLLWKYMVRVATLLDRPTSPLSTAKVTITFRSSVVRDHDNIIAACKPILDGLVESRIIENDAIENIGFPTYAFEKCKRSEAGLIVTVESV